MKTLISCALVAIALLAACERQFPTTPGVISQDSYPIIQTANPWTFPTPIVVGASVRFELIYNSNSPIKEINAYQVINRTPTGGVTTRDTTRFFTGPYQSAFSRDKGGDTLLINYTYPSIARPAGTTVAVNIVAEVVAQSGLFKRRAFSTANGFTLPVQ
ncbi:MAG: hypothetical protein JNN25_14960 [Candidatus Kapabacteria bacterium]|nr:hypothetical protein [Candidatus Kapabacteria bacterium]